MNPWFDRAIEDWSPEAAADPTTRNVFLKRAAGGALAASVLGGIEFSSLLHPDAARSATRPSSNAVRRFHSRSDLRPPRVTVLRAAPSEDCLFLAPSSGPGQRGALILDGRGDIVWFRSSTPLTTMNFRAASLGGKPVLTWWEGRAERGLGRGAYVIMD